MTSGHKRDITTLRERAKSTDRNRAQAFLAADRAEMFRFLFDLRGNDASGSRPFELGEALLVGDIPPSADPNAIDTPVRADVFAGLVVTPIVGTTSVHISPGVVGLHDPDGQTGSSQATVPNADDSPYKIVVEPTGIQTNGLLVIGANAGPGARLDVIECRRTELVLETDVRDIFDPPTGTSTPQTVDKVGAGRLEFRVRIGVAGANFIGPVQGWLPLAVASVPSGGGASTDDVDFWDVRPVVKDRVRQPYRTSYLYSPKHEMQQLYGDIVTAGGENRISGHVWAQIGGILAGGEISRGSPGADQAFIDALDAEWQEDGFTIAANGIVYFWLMFPYRLPRWVRYNRTPIGGLRFPNGMRGIPVISATAPASQSHETPSAALNVPGYLDAGTGETTTDAVCIAAFTALALDTPTAFVAGGEWVEFATTVAPLAISPPTNGTGNAFDDYRLIAGTHFPRDARKVRVLFTANFTGVAGTNLDYRIEVGASHPGGGAKVADSYVTGGERQFDVGAAITLAISVDIERIPDQSGLGPDLFVLIDWNAGGFLVKSAESGRVIGWKQTG